MEPEEAPHDEGVYRATRDALFAVRIVNIDWYMGEAVWKDEASKLLAPSAPEPVIRVFGTTPAGQKACVHVHGVFPHFYVQVPLPLHKYLGLGVGAGVEYDGDETRGPGLFLRALREGLEDALRPPPSRAAAGGSSAFSSPHSPAAVKRVSFVRGVPFFGFHYRGSCGDASTGPSRADDTRLFVRVHMSNPALIKRAANLCLEGKALRWPPPSASSPLPSNSIKLQPCESHFSYLLQFFIDYHLSGMAWMCASDVRFRMPMPAALLQRSQEKAVLLRRLQSERRWHRSISYASVNVAPSIADGPAAPPPLLLQDASPSPSPSPSSSLQQPFSAGSARIKKQKRVTGGDVEKLGDSDNDDDGNDEDAYEYSCLGRVWLASNTPGRLCHPPHAMSVPQPPPPAPALLSVVPVVAAPAPAPAPPNPTSSTAAQPYLGQQQQSKANGDAKPVVLTPNTIQQLLALSEEDEEELERWERELLARPANATASANANATSSAAGPATTMPSAHASNPPKQPAAVVPSAAPLNAHNSGQGQVPAPANSNGVARPPLPEWLRPERWGVALSSTPSFSTAAPKKSSTCELEADVWCADLLNPVEREWIRGKARQEHNSNINDEDAVGGEGKPIFAPSVLSLAILWEEERQRRKREKASDSGSGSSKGESGGKTTDDSLLAKRQNMSATQVTANANPSASSGSSHTPQPQQKHSSASSSQMFIEGGIITGGPDYSRDSLAQRYAREKDIRMEAQLARMAAADTARSGTPSHAQLLRQQQVAMQQVLPEGLQAFVDSLPFARVVGVADEGAATGRRGLGSSTNSKSVTRKQEAGQAMSTAPVVTGISAKGSAFPARAVSFASPLLAADPDGNPGSADQASSQSSRAAGRSLHGNAPGIADDDDIPLSASQPEPAGDHNVDDDDRDDHDTNGIAAMRRLSSSTSPMMLGQPSNEDGGAGEALSDHGEEEGDNQDDEDAAPLRAAEKGLSAGLGVDDSFVSFTHFSSDDENDDDDDDDSDGDGVDQDLGAAADSNLSRDNEQDSFHDDNYEDGDEQVQGRFDIEPKVVEEDVSPLAPEQPDDATSRQLAQGTIRAGSQEGGTGVSLEAPASRDEARTAMQDNSSASSSSVSLSYFLSGRKRKRSPPPPVSNAQIARSASALPFTPGAGLGAPSVSAALPVRRHSSLFTGSGAGAQAVAAAALPSRQASRGAKSSQRQRLAGSEKLQRALDRAAAKEWDEIIGSSQFVNGEHADDNDAALRPGDADDDSSEEHHERQQLPMNAKRPRRAIRFEDEYQEKEQERDQQGAGVSSAQKADQQDDEQQEGLESGQLDAGHVDEKDAPPLSPPASPLEIEAREFQAFSQALQAEDNERKEERRRKQQEREERKRQAERERRGRLRRSSSIGAGFDGTMDFGASSPYLSPQPSQPSVEQLPLPSGEEDFDSGVMATQPANAVPRSNRRSSLKEEIGDHNASDDDDDDDDDDNRSSSPAPEPEVAIRHEDENKNREEEVEALMPPSQQHHPVSEHPNDAHDDSTSSSLSHTLPSPWLPPETPGSAAKAPAAALAPPTSLSVGSDLRAAVGAAATQAPSQHYLSVRQAAIRCLSVFPSSKARLSSSASSAGGSKISCFMLAPSAWSPPPANTTSEQSLATSYYLPSYQHAEPHFSRPQDVPAVPRKFAGVEWRNGATSLPYLRPFDTLRSMLLCYAQRQCHRVMLSAYAAVNEAFAAAAAGARGPLSAAADNKSTSSSSPALALLPSQLRSLQSLLPPPRSALPSPLLLFPSLSPMGSGSGGGGPAGKVSDGWSGRSLSSASPAGSSTAQALFPTLVLPASDHPGFHPDPCLYLALLCYRARRAGLRLLIPTSTTAVPSASEASSSSSSLASATLQFPNLPSPSPWITFMAVQRKGSGGATTDNHNEYNQEGLLWPLRGAAQGTMAVPFRLAEAASLLFNQRRKRYAPLLRLYSAIIEDESGEHSLEPAGDDERLTALAHSFSSSPSIVADVIMMILTEEVLTRVAAASKAPGSSAVSRTRSKARTAGTEDVSPSSLIEIDMNSATSSNEGSDDDEGEVKKGKKAAEGSDDEAKGKAALNNEENELEDDDEEVGPAAVNNRFAAELEPLEDAPLINADGPSSEKHAPQELSRRLSASQSLLMRSRSLARSGGRRESAGSSSQPAATGRSSSAHSRTGSTSALVREALLWPRSLALSLGSDLQTALEDHASEAVLQSRPKPFSHYANLARYPDEALSNGHQPAFIPEVVRLPSSSTATLLRRYRAGQQLLIRRGAQPAASSSLSSSSSASASSLASFSSSLPRLLINRCIASGCAVTSAATGATGTVTMALKCSRLTLRYVVPFPSFKECQEWANTNPAPPAGVGGAALLSAAAKLLLPPTGSPSTSSDVVPASSEPVMRFCPQTGALIIGGGVGIGGGAAAGPAVLAPTAISSHQAGNAKSVKGDAKKDKRRAALRRKQPEKGAAIDDEQAQPGPAVLAGSKRTRSVVSFALPPSSLEEPRERGLSSQPLATPVTPALSADSSASTSAASSITRLLEKADLNQHLSVMAIECVAMTRGNGLLPDPAGSTAPGQGGGNGRILAICYAIHDDDVVAAASAAHALRDQQSQQPRQQQQPMTYAKGLVTGVILVDEGLPGAANQLKTPLLNRSMGAASTAANAGDGGIGIGLGLGLGTRLNVTATVRDEMSLLFAFIKLVRDWDIDILCSYEAQGTGGLGYIIDRGLHLGLPMDVLLSRMPASKGGDVKFGNDRWGEDHDSGIWLSGRVVLNVWRLMRAEVKLGIYTFESVVAALLNIRFPHYHHETLAAWWVGSAMPRRHTPNQAAAAQEQAKARGNYSSYMTHDINEAPPLPLSKAQQPSSELASGAPGPSISARASSRWRVVDYLVSRAVLTLQMLIDAQDLIGRNSEMARLLGIDFYSVISRGSQYRVEAVMARVAKPFDYILPTPSVDQTASQAAMEVQPLIMEPRSRVYSCPVAVLDFQSLYPSIVIGYNMCYSTVLGRLPHLSSAYMGTSSASTSASSSSGAAVPAPKMRPHLGFLHDWQPPAGSVHDSYRGAWEGTAIRGQEPPFDYAVRKNLSLARPHRPQSAYISPNGVVFAPWTLRRGILPRMLADLLDTRVMVKAAMKTSKEVKADPSLVRLMNARQHALKMVANTTYGYTAAGFSGRMPCAEIADAIVQTARTTLERTIRLVEGNKKGWAGARVVYGDTDSLFVALPGRTVEEAFRIGEEIAAEATARNPRPMALKLEKIYHPCVLVAKKRYAGVMYESPKALDRPTMDVKGLEMVRRDTCGLVAKAMDLAVNALFSPSVCIASHLSTNPTIASKGLIRTGGQALLPLSTGASPSLYPSLPSHLTTTLRSYQSRLSHEPSGRNYIDASAINSFINKGIAQALARRDASAMAAAKASMSAYASSAVTGPRVEMTRLDLSRAKAALTALWTLIEQGSAPPQDFIFAKEVRLGSYRALLPPAAIVAEHQRQLDPLAVPKYGERVRYIVRQGHPKATLATLVVDPHVWLRSLWGHDEQASINGAGTCSDAYGHLAVGGGLALPAALQGAGGAAGPWRSSTSSSASSPLFGSVRINAHYYITKQVIPALERVITLCGGDVASWYQEMKGGGPGGSAGSILGGGSSSNRHRPQALPPLPPSLLPPPTSDGFLAPYGNRGQHSSSYQQQQWFSEATVEMFRREMLARRQKAATRGQQAPSMTRTVSDVVHVDDDDGDDGESKETPAVGQETTFTADGTKRSVRFAAAGPSSSPALGHMGTSPGRMTIGQRVAAAAGPSARTGKAPAGSGGGGGAYIPKQPSLSFDSGVIRVRDTTIDAYVRSGKCEVCGGKAVNSTVICSDCASDRQRLYYVTAMRAQTAERAVQQVLSICRACTGFNDGAVVPSTPPGMLSSGGDGSVAPGLTVPAGVMACDSLDCPIFFERGRLLAEYRQTSAVARALQELE